MKGCRIVMDNAAPIHSPDFVDPVIIGRNYVPVYLPPYSPELNSIIEMFWEVLKDRIKRNKLSNEETLTSRVIEHLQSFIQHSIKG